jgi:ubiquinone/menaquinone biosynthesis C-methylase UbiE
VDIRREVQPDILASLEDLWIFPDSTISEVYFCHGPEHLSERDIEKCIRDIRRMMIPGGILRLAMPDFNGLVKLYLDGKVTLGEIRPALYGGQEYPENTHFSAWDFKSFSYLLSKCGFSDIEVYDPRGFLPPGFFDYSLHQLKGVRTILNIKCRALAPIS